MEIPESVSIRGHCEGQLIVVLAARFKTTHHFWCQVAEPTWWNAQGVTFPVTSTKESINKLKKGSITFF